METDDPAKADAEALYAKGWRMRREIDAGHACAKQICSFKSVRHVHHVWQSDPTATGKSQVRAMFPSTCFKQLQLEFVGGSLKDWSYCSLVADHLIACTNAGEKPV